jgi:two-component system, NtrC family, sensor histidine kinase HydH
VGSGGVSRGLTIAVVASVALVFALAYVDLRREQARALDDFSGEQAALARTLAASVATRLSPDAGAAGGAALHRDGDRFLGDIRADAVDASMAPSQWILMDDAHRWAIVGRGDRDDAWQNAAPTAELGALWSAMARGEQGTMFLSRPSAAALGLDMRTAVAGWAPVPLRAGGRWSVAVVASARRVRDRATLAAWRLAAAIGLTALLVGLFGVAIMRQQRRAQALGDALRLAEATAALRERSEKLVESVPLGVAALDAGGRVTAVNPFLADRGARAGASLADAIAGLGADERAPLEALVADARGSRATQARQGLAVTLDKKPREVDAFAIPLARPLADVDCFLVLHDRTDMRRLERSLVRAEKLATIGTLSAGIAHEVGTPLGIISGRAEQLLTRVPAGDAGEPMRKGLSSILAQVDKLSTTIRQLLDFARTRPVTVEAVSAATALGAAASLLEHRFRQAKVDVATDAPPSLPPLAADPGQLEQVLVNLMMNACDACAAGGHVTARARVVDDAVALEIADDGSGIAPEHLPSVLDPFFTTKKRGQGTGLGLTIAADIVKNHGGTLSIDSALGRGTTVRVVWPRARAGEEA